MVRGYKSVVPIIPAELFRLKPLLAGVRMVIAGGVFWGSITGTHAENVLPEAADKWVTAGSASKELLGNALNINQHSERAVLNWKSFNVGERNAVNFQQLSSSSIALNRIGQNDPSRILGKLTANGQIYLYNQNGFVFGKDSSVNVNTLVATALNVSDDAVLNRSIATEFDNNRQAPALSGKPGSDVGIKIEAGAQIKIGENGRLIMAAPNIDNAGSLEADKFGQIILVASKDKVFLQPAAADSPFAGLLVEVDTGGKVSNIGEIVARQGNVTLAGFAVNQQGRISATTSVNVNGSVRLIAREGHALDGDSLVATSTTRSQKTVEKLNDGLGRESRVTFGSGSVTEVVADADGGTAIDEQEQPLPYLETVAHTVHLQSGSTVFSPGGKVDITATGDPLAPEKNTAGRILMEDGAVIDVSGNKNISASVERNVVDLSVQSFELRDSPLQKGGVLQGQTIKVDIRDKNPIVDISGALARVERGIDERLGKGGTVNLTSSGDVVVNSGAKIDISGGVINYEQGYVNTTKLITDYGKVVDIADANPDEHYQAIYGLFIEEHPKWGVTRVWHSVLTGQGVFEPGYQQGLDAGALNIETGKLSWQGDLAAGSVAGLLQREVANRSFGGSWAIDTKTFNLANQGSSGSPQNVLFASRNNSAAIGIDDVFPKREDGRPDDLVLSSKLINRSHLQRLTIKTLGQATIAEDASINMGPKGEFGLVANGIDVAGDIYNPGGKISLASGYDASAVAEAEVTFNASAQLKLADTANLDVSGRWVNDFALGLAVTPTRPIPIDAGSIDLRSTGDLTTEAGSTIAANGGAWFSRNEQLTAGKAGAIGLLTLGGAGVSTTLNLRGEQSAYGLLDGGSLLLRSGKIVVGAADSADMANNPLLLEVKNNNLNLASSDSFGEIQLQSNFDDVVVKAATTLNLIQTNLFLQQEFRDQASSKSLLALAERVVLPEHLRNPVDIGLVGGNNLRLETGSRILADKQATVSLSALAGGIYVDGLVDAPAGTIDLSIVDSSNPYSGAQAIWLGEHGRLTAAGTTRMNPVDGSGRRTGEVLAGGTVALTAKRGYVVLEEGSKIDVSGTKASLDLLPENAGDSGFIATEIGSRAGQIQLTAAEGLVLDGDLTGRAGTASTQAGRLEIGLNRIIRNPPQAILELFPVNPLNLSVQQRFEKTLAGGVDFGTNLDKQGLSGKGLISADSIAEGGFSDIRLATVNVGKDGVLAETGSVTFKGDVKLTAASSIDIDAPNINWQSLKNGAAGNVELNTAYFRAGSSVLRETARTPKSGAGRLTVHSLWTQLEGLSSWSGFNTLNLDSRHDLRAVGVVAIDGVVDGKQNSDYRGELVTAANLNLTASQVYPSTLSKFTFAVENNPNGKITVSGSGNSDASPLSAAGELTFKATNIEQNGTVRAPFGTIKLLADKRLLLGDGSLTSVSGAGQLIPFGVTFSGLDWLYPIVNNNNLVFDAPPEKNLLLSGQEVVLDKGSRVDVSGGGDLLAYEFQPGIGGSFDYLASDSPSYNGGFAILPALGSALAPYDHLQQGNYQAVGSQVYLSGADSLAAGFYTLLPARYALLPGAFLVTPVAGTQDQRIATRNVAGLPVVPGYRTLAGTGARDPRWSGFLIENGDDIRKRSQYDESTANTFFTQRAERKDEAIPLLPKDSGQVSIQNVQTQLTLAGDMNVASPGGRGARLDIAANRLKIVKALSAKPTAGVLEILADDLTGLHVDSLLLGGGRSINRSTGATEFTITSKEITFAGGSALQGTDLIAAATDKITVEKGARLEALGTVNTGDSQFDISGDGALLRVSADSQVELNRTSSNGNLGELTIEAGAALSSTQSMLLDASRSTRLAGDIKMQGGSLNLSANAINLGEVDGLDGGALNLSNDKLLNLAVDELILNSRNGLSFYGDFGQREASGAIAPIHFNRLVVNASGLADFGDASQSVNIQAQTLELANPRGATAAGQGTGHSRLNLAAQNYRQGEGDFGISGFNNANISVADGFNAVGNANLSIAGDLHLTSGYLSATNGNNLTVTVQGLARFDGNGSAAIAEVNYGGAIDIAADTLVMDAKVALPSGNLGLRSRKGDILVGSHAQIDLSGDAVPFADVYDYTPGGVFSAKADQGRITLAAGSRVDLNPGGGAAAGGQLILQAEQQSIALLGQITANSGSVVYDVAKFNDNAGFDELVKQLSAAGVSDSVYIRAREAGIEQSAATAIQANDITLVADRSTLSVAGAITAKAGTNGDGGAIKLYAGDGITLKNGAQLTAKGQGGQGKGGKVLLSATDADNNGLTGITLAEGSSIDVTGSGSEQGGQVVLRTLRTDSNGDGVDDGVALQPIKGKITGFSDFYVEAVKKYGNQALGDDGAINLADIAKIKADTDAYMSEVAKRSDGLRVRPGIEIDYQGDLILKDHWDLVDWRYAPATGGNAAPGGLSIAATGDLNFQNSLTDGFRTVTEGAPAELRDILQTDDSWSYQLVAGADLSSADKTTDINSKNSFTVAKNTLIRTGTGDIDVAASGDVVFLDNTSAIYSAGKAELGNRYGSFGDTYVKFQFYGEYPLAGGDLTINAGGDIKGALNQAPFINNWLERQGQWSEQKPTAWAIHFAKFDQNVGSFGGGAVAINAGGNIDDLAVMMPTTGKQLGRQKPGSEFNPFETNIVQVGGGGQLQVNAGGNIAGGVYYLGRGDGRITAGGNITGSSKPEQFSSSVRGLLQGPQVLMGDTRLEITAHDSVSLSAVSDPMILDKPLVNNNHDVNFFSYSQDSAIRINSLSGDVVLDSDASVITSTFQATTAQTTLSKIYPASLYGTSFGGDVLIAGDDTDIVMFPSAKGELNLFAKGDIAAASQGIKRLGMSDFDPALLPDVAEPLSGTALQSDSNNIASFLNPFSVDTAVHAQRPLHRGDDKPARIATQQGDIHALIINLPKQAIVQSGHDFNNVSLAIQHANLSGDASVISAARDIVYQTNRSVDFGTLEGNTNKIEISGPGDVLIKAGRNIDLGTSIGVSTVGSTFNSNLPSNGANVTVLAGLNGAEPDYLGLLKLPADVLLYSDNYFLKYQQLITEFMRERTGNTVLTAKSAIKEFNRLEPADYASLQPRLNALASDRYPNLLKKIQNVIVGFMREQQGAQLTREQALAAFKQLEPLQYLPIQTRLNTLANRLLFSVLNETGSAVAKDANDKLGLQLGNEIGFAAIEALYPGADWKGDVNLFFSKLQTLADGSINLLVPGGNINAGLAVVANDLQKASSDLGIVVQRKGNINAFVKDDFIVNQSRVFALGGGDILIWSSEGNIDAGRGAKSAIAAPPPIIRIDESGNLVIDFPPVVSGSGIRTAAPVGTDIPQGDVALFAPGGVVDAGEAGIGGKNVTIAATAVIGANNISVSGVGTGVPSSSSASLAAGLTGVSNLTANVSQVAQASADLAKENNDAAASGNGTKLGTLSVELLGFGDGSTGDNGQDKKRR